jgi:NitT/TauT family transport system permease protein
LSALLDTQRRQEEKALARRAFWNDVGIRVAFLVFLTLLWQAVYYVMVVKTDTWSGALFPSPLQVGEWLWQGFGLSYLSGTYTPPPGEEMPTSFWGALRQAAYPNAIRASLWRLMFGYVIALAFGIPAGLLIAKSWLAEKTLGWMAVSLQALPSICWVPLAFLWFGRSGELGPVLFVTVFGSVFATIIAVADGIRNVPPLLARAGRTLGASGFRLYWSVLLPAALPAILTGLKIGWSFAWRSLMAAELIVAVSSGLGYQLKIDDNAGDGDGVVASLLVIILVGLGAQALLFSPLERRLQQRWGFTGAR